MAEMAVAFARLGHRVTYVAQETISQERVDQGWSVPALPGVSFFLAESDAAARSLVQTAEERAVHICQGLRANGHIRAAQRELTSRGRRQWVVMETVDDSGWAGVLKRLIYAAHFRTRSKSLGGILANGYCTSAWVEKRGMPPDRVFPFAYFLPERNDLLDMKRTSGAFRFLFAGQLIARKRVDWLIEALTRLTSAEFELRIVGCGPEETALREICQKKLGQRVRWIGTVPQTKIPEVMAQVDCLVLPSLHDGWGAVASEALIAGTPVICSDSCGVAGVVRASGRGGVFPTADRDALVGLLAAQLAAGPFAANARGELARWAKCLGATAGAAYLSEILSRPDAVGAKAPVAPWLRTEQSCAA